MKTLHSLSDLKKLKLDEPAKKPAISQQPVDRKPPPSVLEPASAPKRTPREEFAALLGDAAPPPTKRGIGHKVPISQPAENAPERPQKAPPLPKPPTIRLTGAAGSCGLTGGNTAVLPPGESTLTVSAEGFAPIEVKLVVEEPPVKVEIREDAARDAALARVEAEASRLHDELAKVRAENAALRAKAKAVIRITTDDLFPGEGYEHAIEALAREAEAAKAVDGRRAELLAQVVAGNPPATELPRRRRIVDEVIVSARRPGPRELARLAEIGIREVSKNKHYKLGYGRHTQVLALTPSDHRGGMNSAADMKKKFF